MCEPTTIALVVGAAVSVATTAAAAAAQNKTAHNQADSIKEGYANTAAALAEKSAQENKLATDQMGLRARQALIERGRLRAAQAGTGLYDNSGALERSSYFNQSTDIASIESNRSAQAQQDVREAFGAYAGAQSNLNSIKMPNYVASGLQIAGTGLDAYSKVPNSPK